MINKIKQWWQYRKERKIYLRYFQDTFSTLNTDWTDEDYVRWERACGVPEVVINRRAKKRKKAKKQADTV